MVCSIVENGARNEVLSGGYSASQRATGRSSTMLKSMLHETKSASAFCEPNDLIVIQQLAQEAYLFVRSNRALSSNPIFVRPMPCTAT